MGERVLITGAAGMIGLALAKNLLKNGYTVRCFDLYEQFLRQKAGTESLKTFGNLEINSGTIMDRWAANLAATDCDIVIHLAAMLGVRRTEENRLQCMDINVNGTENVLNACSRNQVKHFVLASSSEVYGEPSHNPISEEQETKGKTVYAVSKMAAEELTKGYHQITPSLNYSIVRFFNTYGEGQVAQFALSRFVKRAMENQNPIVYGDGSQKRSFCHVTDAVEGVRRILVTPRARNRIYNIGNSQEVFTLAEAAQKVIEVLAPNGALHVEKVGFENSDRSVQREIFTRYCDTQRAMTELGYRPAVTLEEGIRRIAAAGEIHDSWTNFAEK